MDELLQDFLTETAEHIADAETQLVLFERDPTDASLISSIFRLVHTIKGTSGFLGLNRLQEVAHAAETLLGDLRDGAKPTPRKVSLILAAIDRIRLIVDQIGQLGAEPDGNDNDIIDAFKAHVSESDGADAPTKAPATPAVAAAAAAPPAAPLAPAMAESHDESDHSDKREPDAAPRETAARQGGGGTPAKSAESIRVAVDTIERIMQLVSELVLTRNQLLELTRHRDDDTLKSPAQRLSTLTTDLQDAVMRARMQPMSRVYSNLPRLVRELSAELGKKIDLVTDGADTELDRQLIDVIRDPMTHMIRNCADHGLESPDVRVKAGKPEFGTIRVAASHEAGQITIEISDDGRGLDVERIKQKAIATGLASEQDLARMSNEEAHRFIFAPGLSTAAKVTNVSGRGVGMDVVRSNIESIGGSVSVSSTPGKGSRFTMKIPLTLAIAPALIIRAGGHRFALPQTAVVEAVGLGSQSRHLIETVQNALVLKLRDEVVPVVELRSILGLEAGTKGTDDEELAIIVRVGTESFGLIVDGVSDVQEIVVKPLSSSHAHLKTFSGHTILGDGSVVLILDPGGLAVGLGIEKAGEKKAAVTKDALSTRERTRLVLFRAGGGSLKVMPLSLVSRIEMVDAGRIEMAAGRAVVLHQGRLMPILPISPATDMTTGQHPVLVTTIESSTIGLMVDEIVDILEERLDIQLSSYGQEMVGSAEIRGQTVELVDVLHFVRSAYPEIGVTDTVSRPRIVLLDKDQLYRDMLAPVLAAAGYDVAAAAGAREALAALQTGPLRALVGDSLLLGQATCEFTIALVAKAKASGAPVIALTTSATGRAEPAGVTIAGFAPKLDPHALVRVLNAAVQDAEAAAPAQQPPHRRKELAA